MKQKYDGLDIEKISLCELEVTYNPTHSVVDLPKISEPTDSYGYFIHTFKSINYREFFYMLCLNRDNKVLGYVQVSAGGMTGTVVDIKMIMQIALLSNASNIIVCHNHPSGNINPSEADKTITKKIKDACNFLDIKLLDHLIIIPDSDLYFSFANEGLI